MMSRDNLISKYSRLVWRITSMVPLLLLIFNPVMAQEPLRNDASIDIGLSSACLMGCINFDRQISEKLDFGVSVTPLLIFNGGGFYGQYTLSSSEKNLLFIEPSAGIVWSILSREILYGVGVELGYERNINDRLFGSAHLGAELISYDLDSPEFYPNARLGIGSRF
jgi:hypothetical protein